MSDLTNPVDMGSAMTLEQAVAHRTSQAQTEQLDISKAASALGRRSAEARQARNAPIQNSEEEAEAEEQSLETTEPENTPEQAEPESTEEDSVPLTGQVALPSGEKITVDELIKGHLRQSDYTRKTQEIAEMRRGMEARVNEQVQALQNLYQQLAPQADQEPNWAELATQVDPWEYNKQRANWEQTSKQRANAHAALQQQQARQFQDAKMNMVQSLQSGEFDRSWSDQAVFSKSLDKVVDYARSQGFHDNLLMQITDPKMVIQLEKARRWDELQRNKPAATKAVQKAPRVATPGSKTVMQQASDRSVEGLRTQLTRTGSIDDAVSLYKASRNLQ